MARSTKTTARAKPDQAEAVEALARVPNPAALAAIAELEDATARGVPWSPATKAWFKAKFAELRSHL
jgi:hypothetical protein